MKNRRSSLVLGCVIVFLLSTGAVSIATLKKDVAWFASPAREGRKAGAPGAMAAGEYLAGRFKENGFEAQMQDFGNNRRNVVARSGSAEKYVLIGSHYDGQGIGYPSATDNAAGAALLVELGRELNAQRLPVSVVLVGFDDEEQGLNGSRYYSDHPIYPLENAVAAIIFDTMGRSFIDLQSWTLLVLGAEYSTELAQIVTRRTNPEMLLMGSDLIGPRSDFAAFATKRVPYLFFSNGTHVDYHGPGDTAEKINYPKLAKDAALIAQITADIARLNRRPVYLSEPVYPPTEKAKLICRLSIIEQERKELPAAYRLMFDDMKSRIAMDTSREAMRVATAGLLAVATPRFSGFMLTFYVAPFYERENQPEIASAIYEEAVKWTADASERRELEEKIKTLRRSPVPSIK